MDQQLFLNLTTGAIPSPRVVAVNLDSYSIAQQCSTLAVFIKGGECLYIPETSKDAQAVAEWANSQPGEQFLALPPFNTFNAALITGHEMYGDKIIIDMADIGTFGIPATAETVAAYHRWTGALLCDDDTTQKRHAVLV
jgi:hypothetical protein